MFKSMFKSIKIWLNAGWDITMDCTSRFQIRTIYIPYMNSWCSLRRMPGNTQSITPAINPFARALQYGVHNSQNAEYGPPIICWGRHLGLHKWPGMSVLLGGTCRISNIMRSKSMLGYTRRKLELLRSACPISTSCHLQTLVTIHKVFYGPWVHHTNTNPELDMTRHMQSKSWKTKAF